MKCVMLSIRPKYCELIASGKKTVEIRKTKPKLETPFKCYIYCTKGEHLWKTKDRVFLDGAYNRVIDDLPDYLLDGAVIGEFMCDRIQEITYTQIYNFGRYKDVCEAETRLDFYALDDYLKQKNGYGWHITDLVIYEHPKELSEFEKVCQNVTCSLCEYAVRKEGRLVDCDKRLKRPPQSWCYCVELK